MQRYINVIDINPETKMRLIVITFITIDTAFYIKNLSLRMKTFNLAGSYLYILLIWTNLYFFW